MPQATERISPIHEDDPINPALGEDLSTSGKSTSAALRGLLFSIRDRRANLCRSLSARRSR
jgi:hypothetical protein